MTASKIASWAIIISCSVAFLVLGKNLLIPFVIALLIWYIMISLARWISKIPVISKFIPYWLSLVLSGVIIMLVMMIMGELIAVNAAAMNEALPRYQIRMQQLVTNFQNSFNIVELPNVSSLLDEMDFQNIVSNLVNTLSGFASNAFLIGIYVLFLFTEQLAFPKKIKSLFPDKEDYDQYQEIIDKVNEAIISYLSVKSFVSILTGVLSYLVMLIIGLDFALFWAFVIFILNYIPSIGSIIATLFPALLALIQFDTLTPFFIILFGVGLIQIFIGNFLEPRMMGDSLNISPLVVMLALSLWGVLWGIAGMVLCVPLTVIMIIVFAEFPNTRPIAILLSQNGVPSDD